MEPQEERPARQVPAQPKRRSTPFFLRPAFILFVLLVVLGYLYFFGRPGANQSLQDPAAQAGITEEQIQQVINEMKEGVVISSEDEVKVLGVVENASSLKQEQAFYKDVEDGDYVFVFPNTSRALIWRPGEKKVVNFGVFEVKNDAAVQQQVQTQATPTEEETEE